MIHLERFAILKKNKILSDIQRTLPPDVLEEGEEIVEIHFWPDEAHPEKVDINKPPLTIVDRKSKTAIIFIAEKIRRDIENKKTELLNLIKEKTEKQNAQTTYLIDFSKDLAEIEKKITSIVPEILKLELEKTKNAIA